MGLGRSIEEMGVAAITGRKECMRKLKGICQHLACTM